jgi:hypothetical protein
MKPVDIKKILHYNPDTGIFTRLISKGGKAKGSIAGNLRDHGYIRIVVENIFLALVLDFILVYLFLLLYYIFLK